VTWVRFDDQFADSPKMEQVGPIAGWLHVAAICYSARHLLDGVIPQAKARRLADIPSPAKHIRALVAAGAWHEPGHGCDRCAPCPDGHYLIHDYLEYQRSREEVEAERAAARERMAKRRRKTNGAFANGSAEHQGEHPPNDERSSPDVPAESRRSFVHPDPTRPITEEPTPPLATHDAPMDNPEGETIIDQAIDQAAQRYADHQIASGQGKVRSPKGLAAWWRQENEQGARARAAQLLAEYDLGVTQLADALGQPNPRWLEHYRRRPKTQVKP
jgi:hypothetical protein